MPESGRWPPAYDAEDFAKNIADLVSGGHLESAFYEAPRQIVDLCQGDVIRLNARRPFIDGGGQPRAEVEPTEYWLIGGNSCDLDVDRKVIDEPFTSVVPLVGFRSGPEIDSVLADLRAYRLSRQFYAPPWPTGPSGVHWVAHLARAAAVERQALRPTDVLARMSRSAWALFHNCVIRFWARDDGRYDVAPPSKPRRK